MGNLSFMQLQQSGDRRFAGKCLIGLPAAVERNELSEANLCMSNRVAGLEIHLVVVQQHPQQLSFSLFYTLTKHQNFRQFTL